MFLTLNTFLAILLHGISGQKVNLFFFHLGTTLCRKNGVSAEDNEHFMKPKKILIADSLNTQYVELQRKTIINWNQRRKQKMDVSASLKKSTTNTQKEITRETTKLDWMIHWMQELGPIIQEFVRQNNIREPNCPPNLDTIRSFNISFEE